MIQWLTPRRSAATASVSRVPVAPKRRCLRRWPRHRRRHWCARVFGSVDQGTLVAATRASEKASATTTSSTAMSVVLSEATSCCAETDPAVGRQTGEPSAQVALEAGQSSYRGWVIGRALDQHQGVATPSRAGGRRHQALTPDRSARSAVRSELSRIAIVTSSRHPTQQHSGHCDFASQAS